MAEEKPEPSNLDKLKGVISALKEMEHYSRSNIEKLTAHWMFFEDELKHKDFAKRWGDLINTQNGFEDQVKVLIEDCETYCSKNKKPVAE
jgi:hypothetical protein